MIRWFKLRHPDDVSVATRKRGMSSLRQFLRHCIKQGWVDARVLDACHSVGRPAEGRHWLKPEQVVAIDVLVCEASGYDRYERFLWEAGLALGLRASELARLNRADLDALAKTVTVIGKGTGAGKRREVPVDEAFIASWQRHCTFYGIKPNSPMLFRRYLRVAGAERRQVRINQLAACTSAQSIRRFYRSLQSTCEEQLKPDLAPNFAITPKVMRRTFACMHVILHSEGGGGLDLVSLQEAMGHESLETTRVYLSDVASYLNRRREPTNALRAAWLIANPAPSDAPPDTGLRAGD